MEKEYVPDSPTSQRCRICFSPEPIKDLVTPCFCKGTIGNVHVKCLEKWLTQSRKPVAECELCLYKYKVKRIQMYTCLQSIRNWSKINENQSIMKEQAMRILCMILITIIMSYFTFTSYQLHKSQFFLFIKMAHILTLVVLILSCIVSIFVILRKIYLKWYKWWKTAFKIQIVLENEFSNSEIEKPDLIPTIQETMV